MPSRLCRLRPRLRPHPRPRPRPRPAGLPLNEGWAGPPSLAAGNQARPGPSRQKSSSPQKTLALGPPRPEKRRPLMPPRRTPEPEPRPRHRLEAKFSEANSPEGAGLGVRAAGGAGTRAGRVAVHCFWTSLPCSAPGQGATGVPRPRRAHACGRSTGPTTGRPTEPTGLASGPPPPPQRQAAGGQAVGGRSGGGRLGPRRAVSGVRGRRRFRWGSALP